MSHPVQIDRFRVIRLLGTGGMGNVYEAIDPEIERRVAIKLLRQDILADNPELLQRLFVEARAANAIGHPGVVQISEAKLLPEGTGYLVMELLEGQTLTQRMRQSGGRLQVELATSIALQIASILRAGHQRGIVHRDLKPDNVMLVEDDAVAGGERIKLLDFGIAKLVHEVSSAAPLTLADMGLGTPGYMAPEQMRSAALASDRSDVYGLGAVLFEMLAGRRPHVAASTAELVVQVLSSDAPAVSDFVPALPASLVQLIAQMLIREPPKQRPDIVEVVRRLYLVNAELPALQRAGSALPSSAAGSGASFNTLVAVSSGKLSSQPAMVQLTGPELFSEGLNDPSDGKLRAPSASTISQMRGQQLSDAASPKARSRRRWLAAGAGTVAVLGLALGWRWTRTPVPPVPPQEKTIARGPDSADKEAKTGPTALDPATAGAGTSAAAAREKEPTPPVNAGAGAAPAANPEPAAEPEDAKTPDSPDPIDSGKQGGKKVAGSGQKGKKHISSGKSGGSGAARCSATPKTISPSDPVVVKAVQDAIASYKPHLCAGEQLVIRVNSGDGSLSMTQMPPHMEGRNGFNVNNFLLRIGGKLAASGLRDLRFGKITITP